MKVQARRNGISTAIAAVSIVVIVIVVLASSVVLQTTGIVPNPVGKCILQGFQCVSGNPLKVGMTVTLLGTDGSKYNYVPTGITPMGVYIVSGGTITSLALSQIQWNPTISLTYTGTLTGGSCTESWALTNTNPSGPISAAATAPVSIPSTLTSGGSQALANAYAYSSALAPSGTAAGTYTAGATLTATCTGTFADGSTSTKTATSATYQVQYGVTSSGITALSVSLIGSAN